MRFVGPERHGDLVGGVAHDVEHELDDLGVGERGPHLGHEVVVDEPGLRDDRVGEPEGHLVPLGEIALLVEIDLVRIGGF